MEFTIGQFDEDTKTVPVIFEYAGVTHERAVNAVLDEDGDYDAEKTEARVGEVANGVMVKINVGAIGNAPEMTLPDAE